MTDAGVLELTHILTVDDFDPPCDRDGCGRTVRWVARFAPCTHVRLLCDGHRVQCLMEQRMVASVYCLTCDETIVDIRWSPYRADG